MAGMLRTTPALLLTCSTVPKSSNSDLPESERHAKAEEVDDGEGSALAGSASVVFKLFTQESLLAIEERIAQKKKTDGEDENETMYSDPTLETGRILPPAMRKEFPKNLIGSPIEDLDPYYRNTKSFMVIDSNMEIQRFSADNSLWILSPFNIVRKFLVKILINTWFKRFMVLVLCLHIYFLTSPGNERVQLMYFVGVYALEFIMKILTRGFVLDRFSYMLDPWNYLDIPLILSQTLAFFRSFDRSNGFIILLLVTTVCCKPLQYSSVVKRTVKHIILAVRNTRDIILVILLADFLLAILGVQLYMGGLTQKCVAAIDGPVSELEYRNIIQNSDNWYKVNDEYFLCGNSTGTGMCPMNYTCLQNVGSNPDNGRTSFDNFGRSQLQILRIRLFDEWLPLYHQIASVSPGLSTTAFFAIIVGFGAYFLVALFLMVLVLSYVELQQFEKQNDSDLKVTEEDSRCCGGVKSAWSSLTDKLCLCETRCQRALSVVVDDPFFELFICLVIIVDFLSMLSDHHNMSEELERILRTINYFVVLVYVIEAILKIITWSPKIYFSRGWCRFEFFIVVGIILELGLEGVQGLSVLRSIRILRASRLFKSWTSMNRVFSAMQRSMVPLKSIAIIYFLTITFFTVLGMRLFGDSHLNKTLELADGEEPPRWLMHDFLHTFLIVFKTLCGQWIDSMNECILFSGGICIPYFASMVFVLNLVVQAIFLAVLISGFGMTEECDETPEECKKVEQAFLRIKRLFFCLGKKNNSDAEKDQLANQTAMTEFSTNEMTGTDVHSNRDHTVITAEDETEVPPCCPAPCYRVFPGYESETPVWKKNLRLKCKKILEHKIYDSILITILVLSSLTLCLESRDYRQSEIEEIPQEIPMYVMYIGDIILILTLLVNIVLKWFSKGLWVSFTDFWCLLEMLIYAHTLMNVILNLGRYPLFISCLRPLLIAANIKNMRITMSAVCRAVSSMSSVLLVSLLIWFLYAIMCVQMFAGKFYRCVNDTDGSLVDFEVVSNREECYMANMTWVNTLFNFNTGLEALVVLFQLATFTGIYEVFENAADTSQVDQQPIFEHSLWSVVILVSFIFVGSFFFLSSVVGVLLQKYTQFKKLYTESFEKSITKEQKLYFNCVKDMSTRNPRPAIPPPNTYLQKKVFDLVTNPMFEVVMLGLVFLNAIAMSADHFDLCVVFERVLSSLGFLFQLVFLTECVIKIIGLRSNYFRSNWNKFDFFLVITQTLGVLFGDLMAKYFISVYIIVWLRTIRLWRFPFLYKHHTAGLRTVIRTLETARPTLIQITGQLFIITWMYAIAGMLLFRNTEFYSGLDHIFNFRSFGNAVFTLFGISSSPGWNHILEGLMKESDCWYDYQTGESSCGNAAVAVLFVFSYVILTLFIYYGLYIHAVLMAYQENVEKIQESLTEDDYETFLETWQKFDTDGTGFITKEKVPEFLLTVDYPFRISSSDLERFSVEADENGNVKYLSLFDDLVRDYFKRRNGSDPATGLETLKLQQIKSASKNGLKTASPSSPEKEMKDGQNSPDETGLPRKADNKSETNSVTIEQS